MKRLLLAIFIWTLASLAQTQAHEVRPAFLRLSETTAAQFDVVWKQPVISGRRLSIKPEFPEGCTASDSRLDRTGNTVIETFTLDCNLRSGMIRLPGLERTLTDAFVEISYLDGSTRNALIKPSSPEFSLDGPQASATPEYFRIGIEHIIFGWDHLLFVIGLALLVGGRRVWGVATAFTLAHSLTLAAVALAGVSLPSRPVEILIAASIVLLAVEIMRKRAGHSSLGARRPYLIAFTIGLIHGFGFAGALAEIGLPKGTELLALVLFNLGVEFGQFAIIGLALATLWVVQKFATSLKPYLELAVTYSVAGIAMFWVIERVSGYGL